MFGSSSPFGQQTSSPFGAQQPAFGQTNNATSNPFSPRPFGSTSPFGAQTGASMFGGNATGVFGAPQTPSATPAFGSSTPSFGTTTFGSTSTPAFGSTTTPAFGGSSSPAFGSTTSPPFGTSTFGQKPAFGGFGTPNSAQSSPFGGTIGQTQSTFGATSQPAFGSTSPFGQSTPLFGSTTTPAFGTTSGTPAFGTTSGTPAFGTTGSSFSFGSTGNFGQSSSSPAFGSSSSSPAFGTPTSPFGSTSPGFGTQPTTPSFGNTAFGGQRGGSRVVPYTSTIEQDIPAGQTPGKLTSVSAIPQYKDKSHEELRWEDYQLGDKGGPNPAGQQPAAANAFQQSPQSGMFGQTSSPFGQSPTFGQTSTANPFSSSSTSLFGGKPTVFGGASSGSTFGSPFGTASSSPFGASSAAPSTFGSSTSPFGTTVSSPFGASTSSPTFGSTTFGQSSQSGSLFGSSPSLGSSPFGSSTPFGATQSSGPFQSSSPSFGPTISPFGQQQSTPAFGTTVFGQTPPGLGQTTSTFGQTFGQPTSTVAPAAGPFGQPSPAVPGQTSSPFGSTPLFGQQPTTPNFGQANSGFGQTNSGFGQTNPSFVQTTPSFGNLFSGNTSSFTSQSKPAGLTQSSPSLFGGFQASAPTQASAPIQASSSFSFSGFGQSQGNLSSGFGGTATPFGQNTFTQSTQQSIMPAAPQPVNNPFGTLPAMPQMSIGRNPGSTPALQYGISSMPVNDQPVQSRMSMLTPRHVLTSSKLRMHSRRYNPKKDGTKVSFLSDMEEAPTTPRADAMFIPRENPRALFIQPQEESSAFKPATKVKEIATPITENGNAGGDKHGGSSLDKSFRQEAEGVVEDSVSQKHQKPSQRQNNVEEYNHRGNGYRSLSGHRAGEAAIVYEHGADIEALMPKLRHSDYYTEPKIQELAAKERAERGYCCHVKDFIVGRKGYGYVKFLGETDVRRLDLENIIQFNKCEILVYMDEGKKPPPGQGLNKPAEITLLNVKSVDKKTGQHHPEGPEVEKFRRKLRKKTEDQGADLISYDSIKGEWRFRVKHFSRYYLDESFFEDMLC